MFHGTVVTRHGIKCVGVLDTHELVSSLIYQSDFGFLLSQLPMVRVGGEIGVMMIGAIWMGSMGVIWMGWMGVISPGDVSVVPGLTAFPGV